MEGARVIRMGLDGNDVRERVSRVNLVDSS